MARMRAIKPGIMTNEDLCDLGAYAYILFTSLWMLADRDGRLEYRPRRIKVEGMPHWDEITAKDVENLVEKLCEKGFVQLYEVAGVRYLCITKWREHQHPDPREAQSKLPAPPSVNGFPATSSQLAMELHCQDNEVPASSRVGMGMGMGTDNIRKESNRRNGRRSAAENSTTKITKQPKPPKPKQPVAPPRPVPRQDHRRPPGRATAPINRPLLEDRGTAAWPHRPEDIAIVRDSLRGLAQEVRMPPPDDGIVMQTLDAGHGRDGPTISAVLVELYKRRRFASMYSWGFVPLVVSQVCRAG